MVEICLIDINVSETRNWGTILGEYHTWKSSPMAWYCFSGMVLQILPQCLFWILLEIVKNILLVRVSGMSSLMPMIHGYYDTGKIKHIDNTKPHVQHQGVLVGHENCVLKWTEVFISRFWDHWSAITSLTQYLFSDLFTCCLTDDLHCRDENWECTVLKKTV